MYTHTYINLICLEIHSLVSYHLQYKRARRIETHKYTRACDRMKRTSSTRNQQHVELRLITWVGILSIVVWGYGDIF